MSAMTIPAFTMGGTPEAAISPIQADGLINRLMGKLSTKISKVPGHVWAITENPQK